MRAKRLGGLIILIITLVALLGVVLYWSANSSSSIGPSASVGGGSGCGSYTFITVNNEGDCDSERSIAGTSNQIIGTDNGADSTYVLSLPQDIDTGADVDFGTGVFDDQSTFNSPAVVLQNISDAVEVLTAEFRGPDRATPADNDRQILSFVQDTVDGLQEIGRIESIMTDVSSGTEDSAVRWQVMDDGTLQISAIFQNDDIELTRNGGAYRLRSSDGVVINVSGASQTAASTVFITIPDVGDTSDSFVLEDSTQTLTLKTIDGDNNTFVDVKPDQWDNADTPANGECATYQSNQVQWEVCGASSINVDLPVPSGSTTANSNYEGVPNTTFYSTADTFVVADDIYYAIVPVTEDITINQVSFEVTGTPGNPGDSCRIGLYEADAQWQAGALVADWGQVNSDSSGWAQTSVNTSVAAGNYLSAIICDSGPSIRFHNSATYHTSGEVDTSTTSTTRFVATRRVAAPSGTQHASGFADPGDDWDTLDLINVGGNQHALTFRWSTD